MRGALIAAPLLIGALLAVASEARASFDRPDTVTVSDEVEGMSSWQKYEIRYSFRPATRDYRSVKLTLPLETVQRTIRQIARHEHPVADPASLGVTEAWLRNTLADAMTYCLHVRPNVPKMVFEREYLASAPTVAQLFGNLATVDLSERIAVRFERRGQGAIEIASNETVPFRIPWQVTGLLGSFESFDPQVSRDIADMAPLSGDALRGTFMQGWYQNAVCNLPSIATYYP